MSYVSNCTKHGLYKGEYCGECLDDKDARIADLTAHISAREEYWSQDNKRQMDVINAQAKRIAHLESLIEQEDINSYRLDFLEKENVRLTEERREQAKQHQEDARLWQIERAQLLNSIPLTVKDASLLMGALNNPQPPNEALKTAAREYQHACCPIYSSFQHPADPGMVWVGGVVNTVTGNPVNGQSIEHLDRIAELQAQNDRLERDSRNAGKDIALSEAKKRITELERDKESWGNEFNAIIIMKEQLSKQTERVSEEMKRKEAATEQYIACAAENARFRERITEGGRIIDGLDNTCRRYRADNATLTAENEQLYEALSYVWNKGVCAGELKDSVKEALWPKQSRQVCADSPDGDSEGRTAQEAEGAEKLSEGTGTAEVKTRKPVPSASTTLQETKDGPGPAGSRTAGGSDHNGGCESRQGHALDTQHDITQNPPSDTKTEHKLVSHVQQAIEVDEIDGDTKKFIELRQAAVQDTTLDKMNRTAEANAKLREMGVSPFSKDTAQACSCEDGSGVSCQACRAKGYT